MRKRYQLLVMLLVVSVFTLTACGSKAEVVSVKETADVAIEEVAAEVAVETEAAVVMEESVAETVTEEAVTEEIVEELYIPEGIDMESTLPGEEWVASFVGNVDEPVVVIFNDNTGRKEVVQACSEVIINPDEDRIAAYSPEIRIDTEPYHISIKESYVFDYYEISIFDAQQLRTVPVRDAAMTIKGDKEDWIIEFTAIVE